MSSRVQICGRSCVGGINICKSVAKNMCLLDLIKKNTSWFVYLPFECNTPFLHIIKTDFHTVISLKTDSLSRSTVPFPHLLFMVNLSYASGSPPPASASVLRYLMSPLSASVSLLASNSSVSFSPSDIWSSALSLSL